MKTQHLGKICVSANVTSRLNQMKPKYQIAIPEIKHNGVLINVIDALKRQIKPDTPDTKMIEDFEKALNKLIKKHGLDKIHSFD